MTIAAFICSCSKEYSCENNCAFKQHSLTDSLPTDSIPANHYNYYSASYHIFLAGTGSNKWGYSIPGFDTAWGILDTLEIKLYTTLAYYFSLSNNSAVNQSYSINIFRADSLLFGSTTLINYNYIFNYGPDKVKGQSTFQDSLFVLNNVVLSVILSAQLNRFCSSKDLSFNYSPFSSSHITGSDYTINGFFHDSTYILSTYYYKKKI